MSDTPSKKGDKVRCHIDGKTIDGVIFNDDISGGNMVAILLNEKLEGRSYLKGYGVTLGEKLLADKEKIEKIGEATEEEMTLIEQKVLQLQ